jgi:ketosteroid isomerase-like protein
VSQENVDLVRRAFSCFGEGDIEGLMDIVHEDADWRPAVVPILGVEAVRGKDAVRRFLVEDLFDGFDQFRAEPLSYEDFGDFVLVAIRYTGRGESSGLAMDQTFTTVCEVRDGKAISYCDYSSRAEALAAIGVETATPPRA